VIIRLRAALAALAAFGLSSVANPQGAGSKGRPVTTEKIGGEFLADSRVGCGADGYLVGIEQGSRIGGSVDLLKILCVNIDGYGRWQGAPYYAGTLVQSKDTVRSVRQLCPIDHTVIGFSSAAVVQEKDNRVTRFSIRCAKFLNRTTRMPEPSMVPWQTFAPGAVDLGETDCPRGYIAATAVAASGQAPLAGIYFICSAPHVEPLKPVRLPNP
jgi:hypothetical protein